MSPEERNLINEFHNLYYNGLAGEDNIYLRTWWMNVPCLKCPLDLWIYQEIIVEIKPDLIIETGTHMGGSTLFLAHILDLVGKGEIISIDILDKIERPIHPRIKYLAGSSTDPNLIESIFNDRPDEVRLVILDSDHSKRHVLNELRLFSLYVNSGSYIIVEDTNINGHPIFANFGEGPYEAVSEFLQSNPDFMADVSREKFLMTFNPGGFLKRLA